MREVSAKIMEQESLMEVEERVTALNDVFALSDIAELEWAEQSYLSHVPPQETERD